MRDWEVEVENPWPTSKPRPGRPTPAVSIVSVAADLVVPRYLNAVARHEGTEVELEIELDDRGAPECRRLAIRAEDAAVTGEMVRRIPIARLMRMAKCQEPPKALDHQLDRQPARAGEGRLILRHRQYALATALGHGRPQVIEGLGHLTGRGPLCQGG